MSNATIMLSEFVGRHVKVNLGGPESRLGVLLAVQSDHLVLFTKKDGFVYYQTSHVKAISVHTTDSDSPLLTKPKFIERDFFEDVLERLINRKVKINRGGPESVEGVLSRISENNLVVNVQDNLLFIPIIHIKSISRILPNKNRSSSKKSSSSRNSSGKKSSGKNSSRSSRTSSSRSSESKSARTVQSAVQVASESGTSVYMHNDPGDGSSGSRKSKKSSKGSKRSSSSKRSNSSRSHKSSSSSKCSGSSRSSKCSRSPKSHHNMRPRQLGRFFRVDD